MFEKKAIGGGGSLTSKTPLATPPFLQIRQQNFFRLCAADEIISPLMYYIVFVLYLLD